MLKIFQILLLSAAPFCCLAQFSIQGPSDGNRQAQGLKYSSEKGIEYTDKSASLGTGDFTIQGATDGFSDFKIQGASDANTDFQIQGPSHGGANTYLQDPNDPNQRGPLQPGQGRALQYEDSSGSRLNWQSFAHTRQNQPQAQQARYVPEAPAPRPVQQPRRRPHSRQQQPQQQQHLQQQAPVRAPPNITPFNNAPDQIKQLLQFQAQIPYQNSIPEPFRFDAETAAQVHARQFQEEYPKLVQQSLRERQQQAQPEPQAPVPRPAEGQQYQPRGQYRGKSRHDSRQKRQAPDLSQYKRIQQPAAEPQQRYSTNLPSTIQSLLKYQAQIPYDITANQINYRLDKPYVPQPVQQQQYAPQPQPQQQQQYAPQPQPQQQQYAPQSQIQQYAPQQARPEYTPQYAQGQAQGQIQAQGQNYGQTQAQGQYYGQGAATRPVSERQY